MSLYLQAIVSETPANCECIFNNWGVRHFNPSGWQIDTFDIDCLPELPTTCEIALGSFNKRATELSFKHGSLPATEFAYITEIAQLLSDRLDTWSLVTDDSSDTVYHMFNEGFCTWAQAPEGFGNMVYTANTDPTYLSEEFEKLQQKQAKRQYWATQQNTPPNVE